MTNVLKATKGLTPICARSRSACFDCKAGATFVSEEAMDVRNACRIGVKIMIHRDVNRKEKGESRCEHIALWGQI